MTPPETYASCRCGNAYIDITAYLDDFHFGCSSVTPFEAVRVIRDFCSVNAGRLAAVGSVTGSDPVVPITDSAAAGGKFQFPDAA